MLVRSISVLDSIRRVIKIEGQSVLQQIQGVGKEYELAVLKIAECSGKIVISGVGKSGIIGAKIASSFASIGVESLFMHPTDVWHGDLGAVKKDDVILLISNSGETTELVQLVPALKRLQCTIIILTSNPQSTLAASSDILLSYKYECEADDMNIMPSTSSTIALVLGDSIVITVGRIRNISEAMFCSNHPGGAIGRKARR